MCCCSFTGEAHLYSSPYHKNNHCRQGRQRSLAALLFVKHTIPRDGLPSTALRHLFFDECRLIIKSRGRGIKLKKKKLMKSILLVVFLAFSYLTLGGCATIINGTTQKIPVNTTPHGATAKNQDDVGCITPCSLELKRSQDHIITFSKEGFESKSVTCKHVLSRVFLGYILLPLGLIGAVVDVASGSLYRLTPEAISLELNPVIAKLEKPGLPIDKPKELDDLKKSGTITEEEYDRLRTNILNDFEKK